ncbi:MAG: PocR ligand-binding domain-containing protein [Clostridium sp.]|nr:PocR ligand-binding domain-containing protein [Clostridium sp.]MCM1546812.1 PocR ligand-binding domain-containing protein [Ruminococcus sp.]
MSDIYLTDLIDTGILQSFQDVFSDVMGIAALTADKHGVAVTQGSGFSDFCMQYTRMSPLGKKRCEGCDRMGATITYKSGKPCTYYCHAGLIDFAAPILADGKIIGSFIGGQVLTSAPNLDKTREIAVDLGIDPEEYVEAIKKVKIVSEEKVNKAANLLYVFSTHLSSLAYKSYCLHQSNIKIEKANKMKSDFLANMSHEIRTPMNAVLGMADLALREPMSPAARDYIHQIKTSGQYLLVIINDVLDFSKIESGKLDIIEVEYEPLSLINDLSNVINTRIGNKNVEFTMSISPELPKMLWGDNIRIHQIMLNLLTNAVKFTKEGQVHLEIDFNRVDKETGMLTVSIKDTGIGIKKEDFNRLFDSFQQLDSKRNRNIEGTGLGLPISKRLLGLMDGWITVDSKYGKGSIFTFKLPQKIVDNNNCAVKPKEPISAAILIGNPYVKKQLLKDLDWLCQKCIDLSTTSFDLNEIDTDYFIIEKPFFDSNIEDFFKENPDKQCLIVDKFNSLNECLLPNVRSIRKPIYSINLYNAMGVKGISLPHENADTNQLTFVAPDAKILIVDDNHVNLVVAKGLLEPLKMEIDLAMSASEAIDMVKENSYDLIFMDHMMPEVDGVEATHIIRRLIPGYESKPIIALSANAVGEAKEMFIREGLSDFVAKPIEVKDIVAKLRKWLPQELIVPVKKGDMSAHEEKKPKKTELRIEGLNTKNAISLLGSEELFLKILKEYYISIDKKAQSITDHFNSEKWHNYTIEVHALKSTSRQVGADNVSSLAAELEHAGHVNNIGFIKENTGRLIEEYKKYKEILKDVFPDVPISSDSSAESGEKLADEETVGKMLDELQEALNGFDTLMIDEVIEKMSGYKYPDNQKDYFESIKKAAENSDVFACSDIIKEWKNAF